MAKRQDQKDETVTSLCNEIERLKGEISVHQRQTSDLQVRAEKVKDTEVGPFIVVAHIVLTLGIGFGEDTTSGIQRKNKCLGAAP